jgi:hypothetical protein
MKIWNALPMLLSFVAAVPAWGQTGESTKIHVAYDAVGVRIRPEPGNTNTHAEFTLTLSGRNEIAATATASNGSASKTVSGKGAFGTMENIGDVTGAWHIAGPHRLVQIIDTPQNREINTLTVAGKTCSFRNVIQLKPGSKEYKLYSSMLGAFAYYSQMRFSNITCTIE